MKYVKHKQLFLRQDRVLSLEKGIRSRYKDIYFKNHLKKRECFFSNCINTSIDSHIVSKSRYLKPLSNSANEICELFFDHYKAIHKLKIHSISRAMQFEGFCKSHDNNLFEPIEKVTKIDYNNYYNQLRFAYRAVLYEYRKQEVAIETNLQIEKEHNYSKINPNILKITEVFSSQLNVWEFLRETIETELRHENNEIKKFTFHKFEIPKIEVCSAAVYSRVLNGKVTNHYVTILPEGNKTYLIFGYLNDSRKSLCDEYYNTYYSFTQEEFHKKISDLFILRIETWVTSYKFYKKFLRNKKDVIPKLIKKYLNNKPDSIDYNIFNIK